MSWVFPSGNSLGVRKVSPLSHLDMLKDRGCLFPFCLGSQGTRAVTSCSEWAPRGSSVSAPSGWGSLAGHLSPLPLPACPAPFRWSGFQCLE